MSLPPPSRRAAVRLGRGPRDCERRLLADLAPLVDAGLAAEPVLVVVPSRSLALHLQARLVEHFGRPVLGVRCTTLWALAVSILEDAGSPPAPQVDLFPLLARRHARAEALLAADLGGLRDGYGALLGSVRDLLDAGLEAEHVPAVEDVLAQPPRGVTAREVARALSVARVAGATARDLAACGGGRRSDLLRRAAEAVAAGGPPRCRALAVFGFADATGVAGDLLVNLLESTGGTLYLDEPPDPLAPERADAGVAFSDRFRQRLALAAAFEPVAGGPLPSPDLAAFSALGSEAEVREVARRVRELLDAGARAEAIGVVARRLDAYISPLRVQLHRLGIPYSGLAATGPPGPDGRRARALLELLRSRQRTPIDRWLEASARRLLGARAHQLRAALFGQGAGRLEDVTLPEARPEAAATRRRSHRRRPPISSAVLQIAAEAASEICARLTAWPTGTAAEHAARLVSLLDEQLGWDQDFGSRHAVTAVLAALPADLVLELEELVELLAPALEACGLDPLGGAGGGVQVLDVIEARSRTFEHLFVLGLNRGVFPRLVHEDPMLPDGVRAALAARGAGVLPDLAEKRVGFDEERFLFAQLVAASHHVTLSWQEKNDDNLPLAVSPLVARFLASAGAPTPLPAVRQPVLDPGRGPLTASEAAIVTGLARDRAVLRAVLASVLAAGGRSSSEAGALAAARVELLDELDPQRGTPHGERLQAALGPFFGFVGAAGDDDPRSVQPLFVTHLERLAECPWRFFLERLLRLAPAPDPLEVLPGVEPRLIGSLVHEVLRAIVENEIGSPPATLDEARLRLGVPVAWPDETRLSRLLSRCAEAIVREEGLPLPGLARALAAAAAPILESAREREWDDDTLPEVLAAEIEGGVRVEDGSGRPRRIGFKADRVDRQGDALRLTDYKTGRSVPFRHSAPEARRREMLSAVERARLLQAAAYALAGGQADDEGRYLYLHPDLDEDRPRSGTVRGADAGIAEAFGGAARAALSAWDAGTFFPRFLLQNRSAEHPHCERCEVRDACLRGDSGARLRLEGWLERHLPRPVAPAPATAGEAVLLALWPLGGDE